ncbi:MAG: hypothetical protein ACRENZ_02370, partial [Thermodesulfobacteriota bacterium]
MIHADWWYMWHYFQEEVGTPFSQAFSCNSESTQLLSLPKIENMESRKDLTFSYSEPLESTKSLVFASAQVIETLIGLSFVSAANKESKKEEQRTFSPNKEARTELTFPFQSLNIENLKGIVADFQLELESLFGISKQNQGIVESTATMAFGASLNLEILLGLSNGIVLNYEGLKGLAFAEMINKEALKGIISILGENIESRENKIFLIVANMEVLQAIISASQGQLESHIGIETFHTAIHEALKGFAFTSSLPIESMSEVEILYFIHGLCMESRKDVSYGQTLSKEALLGIEKLSGLTTESLKGISVSSGLYMESILGMARIYGLYHESKALYGKALELSIEAKKGQDFIGLGGEIEALQGVRFDTSLVMETIKILSSFFNISIESGAEILAIVQIFQLPIENILNLSKSTILQIESLKYIKQSPRINEEARGRLVEAIN